MMYQEAGWIRGIDKTACESLIIKEKEVLGRSS